MGRLRQRPLVEGIKSLSTEEKEEIQSLLQQYLREERRDKIYENFQAAQKEQQQGNLKFSNQINELRQLIKGNYSGGRGRRETGSQCKT